MSDPGEIRTAPVPNIKWWEWVIGVGVLALASGLFVWWAL